MTNDYLNIDKNLIPFTNVLVDCYQNMILTVLDFWRCNIKLIGAQWPWTYYIKDEYTDNPIVKNKYLIDKQKLKDIYNLDLEKVKLKNDKVQIMEDILHYLDICPIIINIDQYMVPYHYPHIYGKQHGPHSLMLYGYEKRKQVFRCVDSIPKFKGEIPVDTIIEGMQSFPGEVGGKLSISFIRDCTHMFCKDITDVLKFFVHSLLIPENDYIGSVEHIRNILCIQRQMLPDDSFFNWAVQFCKGTWIWEADHNGNFFVYFLECVRDETMVQDFAPIIEKASKLNLDINITFKKLYKAIFTRRISAIDDVLLQLENCIKAEENLKKNILEIWGDFHGAISNIYPML